MGILDGSIFDLGKPPFLNIAIVSVQPKVQTADAAKCLQDIALGVKDEMSARRMLKELPKQVKVARKDLERLKETFDTAEWFHHERIINGRSVWVTLTDPDGSPEIHFDMARRLMFDQTFGKVFVDAQIVLKEFVITFDRRP